MKTDECLEWGGYLVCCHGGILHANASPHLLSDPVSASILNTCARRFPRLKGTNRIFTRAAIYDLLGRDEGKASVGVFLCALVNEK